MYQIQSYELLIHKLPITADIDKLLDHVTAIPSSGFDFETRSNQLLKIKWK